MAAIQRAPGSFAAEGAYDCQRMHRLPKALLWLGGVVLALPFLAFAAYDVAVFQPRQPEVLSLLAGASPAEQSPPETLRRVLLVSYSDRLSVEVSKLLIRQLKVVPPRGGNIRWHATGAAWQALVALHLTEREQTTLFLTLSPMGDGIRGFSAASPAVVGVPLGEVSLEQGARLVEVSQAPARYLANPARLAQDARALAERASAASTR